jgi:hypothetical protein
MEMAEISAKFSKIAHNQPFWLGKTCQHIVNYANSQKWNEGHNSLAKAWLSLMR